MRALYLKTINRVKLFLRNLVLPRILGGFLQSLFVLELEHSVALAVMQLLCLNLISLFSSQRFLSVSLNLEGGVSLTSNTDIHGIWGAPGGILFESLLKTWQGISRLRLFLSSTPTNLNVLRNSLCNEMWCDNLPWAVITCFLIEQHRERRKETQSPKNN